MMQCSKTQSFILPYPPSVNRYWRHPNKGPLAGRHLISMDGRKYRVDVRRSLDEQQFASLGAARLFVSIVLEVPDRRRRDLDNVGKALLDALGDAGLYADDSQIDHYTIRRGAVCHPGAVHLTIGVIDDELKIAA